MKRHCHAHKCKVAVSPKLFMCPPHWRTLNRVAPGLANMLLLYYRLGQERDKKPSANYISVANECIRRLAAIEYPEDLPGLEKLHAEFDIVRLPAST